MAVLISGRGHSKNWVVVGMALDHEALHVAEKIREMTVEKTEEVRANKSVKFLLVKIKL